MTDIDPAIDPNTIGCCDPETDTGPGFPALPPPCTSDSCSIGVTPLNESGGTLRFYMKLLGAGRNLIERLGEACDPADECGVLRCFADQDGKTLGVGISFAGNPDAIDVDCTDEDGNSLYVNGIRKVRNDDGTCSLGTLPIPLQGKTCVESGGQCTTQFPPGEEGSSYGSDADGGCGPAPCTEITNQSCYPMIVTPKVTITDARIGPGVTYQIQPNIQGNFGAAIDVFSNTQGGCTATAAGTGDTTSGGDPAHTHEGPSHTHTIDCAGGPETYSGTIDQPIVQIAPGETFKFCANASIKYERTVQDAGALNFGQVTACLEYTSLVTPETIAALEGSTS